MLEGKSQMKMKLEGLIAAVYTPMHPDYSINLAMIEKQAALCVEDQIQGVFVCGTTGEGVSLTIDERLKVAERWVNVANGTMPVLVHVGHNCLAYCKTLASHAEKIGATAISAMSPTFFRPTCAADLVAFVAKIAEAAPDLPFYYYHSPALVGAESSMTAFIAEAIKQIPTFAGLKFNHGDLMEYNQCLHLGDGALDILFGCDQIFLSALVLGAKGAIGSTYNYAANIYHHILKAYESGDMPVARQWQDKAVKLVSVLIRFGVLSGGKSIMRMRGVDCGPVRPPIRNLSQEQLDALCREIDSLGILSGNS